jgi:hypothetical protein
MTRMKRPLTNALRGLLHDGAAPCMGYLAFSFLLKFYGTPMIRLRILHQGVHPMSRLSLFAVSLIIIVGIGSQLRHGGGLNKSMCACMPSRARLIVKSAIARTQARSTELFTSRATVGQ